MQYGRLYKAQNKLNRLTINLAGKTDHTRFKISVFTVCICRLPLFLSDFSQKIIGM